MKSLLALAIGVVGVVAAQAVCSEVLHEVQPLSTFGELKKQFPNGRFVRVDAAWVKESEAFYSMTGEGFPGKLFLAFDDSRPLWRESLENTPPEPPEAASSVAEATTNLRRFIQRMADESNEDALTIRWVRWVPSAPIPIERVKAKYGEPTKCDFNEADFTPYCEWESRALEATTSDDRKLVLFLSARFTKGELRSAYKRKGDYMPEWLMEGRAEPKKPRESTSGVSARKVKPTL